jgi:L-aspartate oxidase
MPINVSLSATFERNRQMETMDDGVGAIMSDKFWQFAHEPLSMDSSRFVSLQVPALVVGTGISGLFTALKLASAGIRVLLITKSSLDESNSRYAQGGIAAVLPNNRGDSLELHLRDTIRAGAGLCNEAASRSILAEGFPAIEDLLAYGVPFDREPNQDLALTREAAHSIQRIVHAGGDATGHSVEMTLIGKVRKNSLITVMEYTQAVALLSHDGRCYGCRAVNLKTRQEVVVYTPHTVLATGGIGRLYSHTTNPSIATGDGIALASRIGAEVGNMEFVQFHPTAFFADGRLHFLISEALRGEGGILRDQDGVAFAKRYHPDGELAPRDIVTRAIYAEMQATKLPYVYLDISHLPAQTIEQRFPTILANCLQFGIDIRKDWIPVAPAAHYLMGGITADVNGKTSIPGLYTVGETAYTGLHGANRLASNSLLECVVLARRVACCIAAQNTDEQAAPLPFPVEKVDFQFEVKPEITDALDGLHRLMWEHVGILRNKHGLKTTLEWIGRHLDKAEQQGWSLYLPDGAELVNQLMVAQLITQAALAREHSLGAHTRTDEPKPAEPLLQRMEKVS